MLLFDQINATLLRVKKLEERVSRHDIMPHAFCLTPNCVAVDWWPFSWSIWLSVCATSSQNLIFQDPGNHTGAPAKKAVNMFPWDKSSDCRLLSPVRPKLCVWCWQLTESGNTLMPGCANVFHGGLGTHVSCPHVFPQIRKDSHCLIFDF